MTQNTRRTADIARLKDDFRLLLGELEAYLRDKSEPKEVVDKRYDRLFGSKESILDSLVIIAELMLKLHQPKQGGVRSITPVETHFGEPDVALIQEYLRKRLAQMNAAQA